MVLHKYTGHKPEQQWNILSAESSFLDGTLQHP